MPRIDLHKPLLQPDVQIAQSKIHRYGVFATRDYSPDELIEESPVIIYDQIPAGIHDYVFKWNDQSAFATGYGSMYNHHSEPNAYYRPDEARQLMIFRAVKPIQAGEEILIDYNEKWFTDRGITPIALSEEKARFQIPYLFEVVMFVIAIVSLFYIKLT